MKKFYTTLTALCLLNIVPLAGMQRAKDILFQPMTVKEGLSMGCSEFELICALYPVIRIAQIVRYNTEERKPSYLSSNAPQKIIDFIRLQAKVRNLDNNIIVLIEEKEVGYSTNTIDNAIFMGPLDAQSLEDLLEKKESNTLTPEEQEQLANHTAAIHHELTHIANNDNFYSYIYNSTIGMAGSAIIFCCINTISNHYIPSLKSNFALHNNLKLIRGIMRMRLVHFICESHIYTKYMELRADDGIPAEKELLEAKANYFQKRHENIIEEIDTVKSLSWKEIIDKRQIIKDHCGISTIGLLMIKLLPKQWFSNSLVTNMVLNLRETHPSDLHRAERFRKRIAELEKQKVMA
jgi:hypothetical protein